MTFSFLLFRWGTREAKKKAPDRDQEVHVTEGQSTVSVPENVDEEYERIRDFLDPDKQKALKAQEKMRQEEKARNEEYNSEELKELIKKLELQQKESNEMFRTYVVFFWMVSNILLIGLVTDFVPGSLSTIQSNNTYFSIILWSVASLAAIRFIGSCTYLLFRLFNERVFDGWGSKFAEKDE